MRVSIPHGRSFTKGQSDVYADSKEYLRDYREGTITKNELMSALSCFDGVASMLIRKAPDLFDDYAKYEESLRPFGSPQIVIGSSCSSVPANVLDRDDARLLLKAIHLLAAARDEPETRILRRLEPNSHPHDLLMRLWAVAGMDWPEAPTSGA